MVEIQEGLFLEEKQMNGKSFRYLHSANGYCFKDMADVVEDESKRPYYKYMALAESQSSWTYEQLNQEYISVYVRPEFEIM